MNGPYNRSVELPGNLDSYPVIALPVRVLRPAAELKIDHTQLIGTSLGVRYQEKGAVIAYPAAVGFNGPERNAGKISSASRQYISGQ